MNNFKVGDIVKIAPEWLGPHEDPDTLYVITADHGEGKFDIYTKSKTSVFGTTNLVMDYMIYKVEL